MKLTARLLSGVVLLCAFSSASFAWGSWSGWAANGKTVYCKATRSNGSERWASATINWDFVCVPEGACVTVGFATIVNVTSNLASADIAGMSRVGGDTYYDEKFGAPAFAQPISLLHTGYERAQLDRGTARCMVQ